MSLPSSAMEGSVVSANRIYITLTLNLPLLSQLWQRGLCQHCMYSQTLYLSSLSRPKWMDNFHGRGSKIPLKATWSCFCWWSPPENQWYMKVTRVRHATKGSLAYWSPRSQHLRRRLCGSCLVLPRLWRKDQYHSQVCQVKYVAGANSRLA